MRKAKWVVKGADTKFLSVAEASKLFNIPKREIDPEELVEFEIALVRSNNEYGLNSMGWSGPDKIILFYSGDFCDGLVTTEEDLKPYIKMAEVMCEALNNNL